MKSMSGIAAGALLFFLSVVMETVAQDASDVIIIRNADSLVGRRINGENVRELIGNVALEQRGVLVYSDRAIHYPARNGAFLEGNVRVIDDTVTLSADQGYYDGGTRIIEGEGSLFLDDGVTQLTAVYGKYHIEERTAEFWDSVVVHDPAGIVYADHLIHRRDPEMSVATGNVRVVDRERGTVVYGNRLEYDSASGYSIMEESPVLIHVDTTGTGRIDTLIVRSESMVSTSEDTLRRFVASGDVRMNRGNLAAIGGLSVFFTDEDELSLTGDPVLWYEDNQVSGDSIHVRLESQQLRQLDVYGRSFAISRSDSRFPERFDQMTGTELSMWFENDMIEKIEVRDQATSLYYLYEDYFPNGVNHVTGDRIIMMFAGGQIDELKIVGGIEGRYYPERLVRGREQSYNLHGFRWRDDRPLLSVPHPAEAPAVYRNAGGSQ
jgi:lipopolysaccharide export system protein LptA